MERDTSNAYTINGVLPQTAEEALSLVIAAEIQSAALMGDRLPRKPLTPEEQKRRSEEKRAKRRAGNLAFPVIFRDENGTVIHRHTPPNHVIIRTGRGLVVEPREGINLFKRK